MAGLEHPQRRRGAGDDLAAEPDLDRSRCSGSTRGWAGVVPHRLLAGTGDLGLHGLRMSPTYVAAGARLAWRHERPAVPDAASSWPGTARPTTRPTLVTDDGGSLSAAGRGQARALGERLRGERIARVWCSPLSRAVQTAEIAAGVLGRRRGRARGPAGVRRRRARRHRRGRGRRARARSSRPGRRATTRPRSRAARAWPRSRRGCAGVLDEVARRAPGRGGPGGQPRRRDHGRRCRSCSVGRARPRTTWSCRAVARRRSRGTTPAGARSLTVGCTARVRRRQHSGKACLTRV